MNISLTINGRKYQFNVSPSLRLLDLLRDACGLTGAKEGCGEGECGACTVLMNGEAVSSCLVMAFQAAGSEIITIEGMAENGELDPLQEAFIQHGAVQCGYCTSGMVLSAKALLLKNPHPTEAEIKTTIAGNLCRCTGYNKIVEAIKDVADHNQQEVPVWK